MTECTVWYVRVNGRVARDLTGKKITFDGTQDEALIKARRRFYYTPRTVEVFNHSAPAPDPHRGDEGRADCMALGY